MPRVTKELMKSLIDARVLPPRHQKGCPKNYLRSRLLPLAAKGLTADEIKAKIQEYDKLIPCMCEK